MKTAVSLPDDLFEALEACAHELKMTRSGLLALAAREFLERRARPVDATQAWNEAIDNAGRSGDDPSAAAFRKRTKRIISSGRF